MGGLCNSRDTGEKEMYLVPVTTPYGYGFLQAGKKGDMQCVKLPFGMAYLHKQWVQDTIDVKTPYGSGRLIGCKGDMQTVQLAFGIAYIKEDNVKDVDH
ncbi:hypothetical protein AAMO2058_001625500 [Amorphochlora amoebiformis]